MEKLQKQIEASIEERMDELKKSSEKFLKNQDADPTTIYFSSITYMRDMINDLENLIGMSNAISRRQELLEMDDFDKEEFLEELLESELDDCERFAKRGYAKFIEERSFEDD